MIRKRTVYLVFGIILIAVGGGFLWFSYTVWQLYFNGPETCTFDQSIAAYGVPTCASIATLIATFAGLGGFLLGLGPVFLLSGKVKPTPAIAPSSTNPPSSHVEEDDVCNLWQDRPCYH